MSNRALIEGLRSQVIGTIEPEHSLMQQAAAGWELSDDAKREIEKIEKNTKLALARAKDIWVR